MFIKERYTNTQAKEKIIANLDKNLNTKIYKNSNEIALLKDRFDEFETKKAKNMHLLSY